LISLALISLALLPATPSHRGKLVNFAGWGLCAIRNGSKGTKESVPVNDPKGAVGAWFLLIPAFFTMFSWDFSQKPSVLTAHVKATLVGIPIGT